MKPVIFLPGILMPAAVRYAPLLDALESPPEAVTKELEVYAGNAPPADYSIGTEVDGLDAFATARGFERFHLYGHSAGGAVALAFAASRGDRLLSLAVDEPATDFSAADLAVIAGQKLDELDALPVAERMATFARTLVLPDVELPPPPPTEGEMAKRPAGLSAFARAIQAPGIDVGGLRDFAAPVYYSHGGLSHPRWEAMASRLEALFADCTVERFRGVHHLNTSHQAQPARVASALLALWARAET